MLKLKKIVSLLLISLCLLSSISITGFAEEKTGSEDKILKAQALINDGDYPFWKNLEKMHRIIVSEGKKKFGYNQLVKLYDGLPEFRKLTEPEYYYELILTDLLRQDHLAQETAMDLVESQDGIKEVLKTSTSFGLNLQKEELKTIKVSELDSKQSKELIKIIDDNLDSIEIAEKYIDVLDTAKTIADIIDDLSAFNGLKKIESSKILMLEDVKNVAAKNGNSALSKATERVIKRTNLSTDETIEKTIEEGIKIIGKDILYKQAQNICEQLISELHPAAMAAIGTWKVDTALANAIAGTDEICSSYLKMKALTDIENCILEIFPAVDEAVVMGTAEAADRVIAQFDFYNAVQNYGLDCAESYVKNVGGKFGTPPEWYSVWMKAINDSRMFLKNTNFYDEYTSEITEINKLDLCFVIDTTGSMWDDIENVRQNLNEIIDTMALKSTDYRMALVDYRDFAERTGYSGDYAYKVQLPFTNDVPKIKSSINNLALGDGGDDLETVYSGLMSAMDNTKVSPWRNDAKKIIILMGDAGPLDPEPYTGYSYEDVVRTANNGGIVINPKETSLLTKLDRTAKLNNIGVYAIAIGNNEPAKEFFENISESTNGYYSNVLNAEEVSAAVIEAVQTIPNDNPFNYPTFLTSYVTFGEKYSNKVVSIQFGDMIYSDYQTNEQGSLVLTNMIPGTYHFKIDLVEGNLIIQSDGISRIEFEESSVVRVEKIILDQKFLEIMEGEQKTLKKTIIPSNSSNQTVQWKSSKPEVAIINKDGVVTAISEGKAIITVTTEDDNKTAECIVTVTKKEEPTPVEPTTPTVEPENNNPSGNNGTKTDTTVQTAAKNNHSNPSTSLTNQEKISTLLVMCTVTALCALTIFSIKRKQTK